jgi:hypothetical protein
MEALAKRGGVLKFLSSYLPYNALLHESPDMRYV